MESGEVTVTDPEQFRKFMTQLCLTFRVEPNEILFDAWWAGCGALSDAQFAHGVQGVLEESEHMPSPAMVRAQAYRWKEEKDAEVGKDSGIPGVPKLEAGEPVRISQREGAKYALNPLLTPTFACLPCLDRRYVRADVMVGHPHFGQAIPCPHCNGSAYDGYVETRGVPDGMPKWAH